MLLTSSGSSLDRSAGLLLPSLFAHAHHEEPQHYRFLPEDAEGHAILGDGLWVDVTPEITRQREMLHMHYVLLEGMFSSRDRGHMGMWSGTINKISRAQLWHAHRAPRNVVSPN